MKKSKPIKVIYRKLGREQASGQFYEDKNLIEIEERLSPKESFLTCIHECLHLVYPDKTEKQVKKAEKIIGNILWQEGYRKVNL